MKRNIFTNLTGIFLGLFISGHAVALDGPISVYPNSPDFGPDWIDVVDYKGGENVSISLLNKRARSVGLLKFEKSFGSVTPKNLENQELCSGTLIDTNLFLTAAHCLTSPGDAPWPKASNGSNLTPFESALLMEVKFNYKLGLDGNIETTKTFTVSQVMDYYFGDLDYAVLKLEGNPGSIYGFTPLSKKVPAANQNLFMIHHPDGNPQQVSFGTSDGLQSISEVNEISGLVYDDMDTYYVSSGSGILDASGSLVAVHKGGEFVNNQPHNYGTSIFQITQDPDNTLIKKIADRSSSTSSGSKIFEFNDPILGNSPKTCSLVKVYSAGGGYTEYSKYKLTCSNDSLHVEVIKTYNPNNRSHSCTFAGLPKTDYSVSGSCSNWRVYRK